MGAPFVVYGPLFSGIRRCDEPARAQRRASASRRCRKSCSFRHSTAARTRAATGSPVNASSRAANVADRRTSRTSRISRTAWRAPSARPATRLCAARRRGTDRRPVRCPTAGPECGPRAGERPRSRRTAHPRSGRDGSPPPTSRRTPGWSPPSRTRPVPAGGSSVRACARPGCSAYGDPERRPIPRGTPTTRTAPACRGGRRLSDRPPGSRPADRPDPLRWRGRSGGPPVGADTPPGRPGGCAGVRRPDCEAEGPRCRPSRWRLPERPRSARRVAPGVVREARARR